MDRSLGERLAPPSAGHRLPSAELQLLAHADMSHAPADGLVVAGGPVSANSFVRGHMRDSQGAVAILTVARHVTAMEDKQTATLSAGISLVRRTAYLERNVDPWLGQGEWRKADSISLWAVENIVELPHAAGPVIFADSGFDPALLTVGTVRQIPGACPISLADWD